MQNENVQLNRVDADSLELEKEEFIQRLRAAGHEAKLDADADVQFTFEGKTFCRVFSERDPSFLNIILPNIYRLDSDEERVRAQEVANRVNRRLKVVKVVLVRDCVWVLFEQFGTQCVADMPSLSRCLRAMHMAGWEFSRDMV